MLGWLEHLGGEARRRASSKQRAPQRSGLEDVSLAPEQAPAFAIVRPPPPHPTPATPSPKRRYATAERRLPACRPPIQLTHLPDWSVCPQLLCDGALCSI